MKTIQEDGYTVRNQVLSQDTLNLITSYYFQRKKWKPRSFTRDKYGLSRYGDFLSETLLVHLLPVLEEATGKKVVPTYSYMRIYENGASLGKHKDRHSCEYSATLAIYSESETHWPIYVESKSQDIPVHLAPGDLMIYKGCEVPHWRNELEEDRQIQIFLHFVDKDGPNAEWQYDKRKGLWAKVSFKHLFAIGPKLWFKNFMIKVGKK